MSMYNFIVSQGRAACTIVNLSYTASNLDNIKTLTLNLSKGTHYFLSMEGIAKTFLDSSTIHGLAYISSTRKLARIIWILVVIIGFIGAGVMIHQSFESWANSPVKTTIETRPITEITLPKVTVCPPKNTFTNLNYDLMMLENMTLDNDTRDELTQYAVGLIQDHVFNEVMNNISLIEEHNRYYNWYRGYTKIILPYWGQKDCSNGADKECSDYRLRYKLSTCATSGNISTHYFGHKFEAAKIERNFKDVVYIFPPSKYHEDRNITLHINVEKNLVQEFDDFYSSIGSTVSKEFSPPGSLKWYALTRKISFGDLNQIQMDSMPGFRLIWYYNKVLDKTYYASDIRTRFKR